MSSQDTHHQRPHEHAQTPTPTTLERDRRIIGRWRKRHAERRLARLLRPRNRRRLARRLRDTARDANERRIRPGPEVLLHYRAAAVRFELLAIAALLEQARDPSPECVNEIHRLLADGDSPLYHPAVHVSELYATLHYIRAGLVRDLASRPPPGPQTVEHKRIRTGRPDAAAGEGRMQ